MTITHRKLSCNLQNCLHIDDPGHQSTVVWGGMVSRCAATRGGCASIKDGGRFLGARNDTKWRESDRVERVLEWSQAFHRSNHRWRSLSFWGSSLSQHTRVNHASKSIGASGYKSIGGRAKKTGIERTMGAQQRRCHIIRQNWKGMLVCFFLFFFSLKSPTINHGGKNIQTFFFQFSTLTFFSNLDYFKSDKKKTQTFYPKKS